MNTVAFQNTAAQPQFNQLGGFYQPQGVNYQQPMAAQQTGVNYQQPPMAAQPNYAPHSYPQAQSNGLQSLGQASAPVVATPSVIAFDGPEDLATGFLSIKYPSEFTGTRRGKKYPLGAWQYIAAAAADIAKDQNAFDRIMSIGCTILGANGQPDWVSIHRAMNEISAVTGALTTLDAGAWQEILPKLVHQVMLYKFCQNDMLMNMLLSTGTARLIYASAGDFVLGIGYSIANAAQVDISQWGKNILGNVLTQVRAQLAESGRPEWAYKMVAVPAPEQIDSSHRADVPPAAVNPFVAPAELKTVVVEPDVTKSIVTVVMADKVVEVPKLVENKPVEAPKEVVAAPVPAPVVAKTDAVTTEPIQGQTQGGGLKVNAADVAKPVEVAAEPVNILAAKPVEVAAAPKADVGTDLSSLLL